jgi:hypothetical protein
VSTALNFRYSADTFDSGPSRATSDEATRLSEALEKVSQSFQKAEALQGYAVRELQDAFLDSREPDWDGYGAHAVPDEAFLKARTFLEHILRRFPSPTAAPTPNGSLAFEWAPGNGRRFIVSIGEEDLVAFAGIFGSETIHGTATFVQDLPRSVGENLRRVYGW